MKTKVLIGWSAATLLCGGLAHAQAQPPPRAAAQPAPQAAANSEPARVQPPPRAVRQVAKPTPAPAAKASGAAEESPYGDEAEGDDGANGAKPTEGAKAPEGAKTTAASKPAAVVPVAAAVAVPAPSPANAPGVGATIAVDGAVIMGMMGSNMNQTMRRGVTAQVTKLAKGISIAYVSDDPKIIERLQQMADAMRLIRDVWSD